MHEKSALRAISFDTGRVASGKSGNWMILADDGGSGSERCGVSFITAPRRSRLARKSGSLIVAAMDKSSWVSIAFLYADCYSSPHTFLLNHATYSSTNARSRPVASSIIQSIDVKRGVKSHPV